MDSEPLDSISQWNSRAEESVKGTASRSGEHELHSGDNEHERQKLAKHRGSSAPASIGRSDPATHQDRGPPHGDVRGKLRYAREMSEKSGDGIHKYEWS